MALMNPAIALAGPAGRRPRLAAWLARAARRLGWQHVALAALISVLYGLIGPNGGVLFFPGERTSDPIVGLLAGRYLGRFLPWVFAVLVADAAFDDGVSPLRTYGLALLFGAVVTPLVDWVVAPLVGWNHLPPSRFAGWYSFSLSGGLMQGGLFMAVYGYWRTTQRSLARVQRAHADRARDEQRLLTVKLLALQARVEPQLLFDTLSQVGRLHAREPARADALLADLIALLRAMLPGGAAVVSDVGRELALVDAWLRVVRALDRPVTVTVVEPDAELAACALAPMLVMPMLRAALAQPAWAGLQWRLGVERLPDARLHVHLQAAGGAPAEAAPQLDAPALDGLRERLAQLHGVSARLSLAHAPPGLLLELPPWPEDAVARPALAAATAA